MLENHPLIRSVTPQRLVHRTLKYIDEPSSYSQQNEDTIKEEKSPEEDDIINYISKHLKLEPKNYNNNDCCVPEFQNFRRGLSSSTDKSQQQQQQQTLIAGNVYSNRRLLRAVPRQITTTLKADVLWRKL